MLFIVPVIVLRMYFRAFSVVALTVTGLRTKKSKDEDRSIEDHNSNESEPQDSEMQEQQKPDYIKDIKDVTQVITTTAGNEPDVISNKSTCYTASEWDAKRKQYADKIVEVLLYENPDCKESSLKVVKDDLSEIKKEQNEDNKDVLKFKSSADEKKAFQIVFERQRIAIHINLTKDLVENQKDNISESILDLLRWAETQTTTDFVILFRSFNRERLGKLMDSMVRFYANKFHGSYKVFNRVPEKYHAGLEKMCPKFEEKFLKINEDKIRLVEHNNDKYLQSSGNDVENGLMEAIVKSASRGTLHAPWIFSDCFKNLMHDVHGQDDFLETVAVPLDYNGQELWNEKVEFPNLGKFLTEIPFAKNHNVKFVGIEENFNAFFNINPNHAPQVVIHPDVTQFMITDGDFNFAVYGSNLALKDKEQLKDKTTGESVHHIKNDTSTSSNKNYLTKEVLTELNNDKKRNEANKHK